ncbi:MAG TPA: hypothetical protein VFK89_04125 [Actinomycetota bacterium]|nr:hypothetical protein [Actinomycetota bacterium]
MSEFHKYLGFTIPAGFGVLAIWAAIGLIRNKAPRDGFWTLLGIYQVVIALQVVLGAILFLTGLRPPTDPVWLHYAYGGLFPAALLIGAHRLAASRFKEVPWVVFGGAALLICGLTIRALMTGLGA